VCDLDVTIMLTRHFVFIHSEQSNEMHYNTSKSSFIPERISYFPFRALHFNHYSLDQQMHTTVLYLQ